MNQDVLAAQSVGRGVSRAVRVTPVLPQSTTSPRREKVLPSASLPDSKVLQTLAINDVLKRDGKVVRLIAANPNQDIAHVIEIEDRRPGSPYSRRAALPYVESYRHLRANWRRIEDPYWDRPLEPSAAAQAVRDERYERIRELVVNTDVLVAKTRGPLLTEHAKKVGVSSKTLLADLRTWWQRGQVKDALLGDYHRSGRVTETTNEAVGIDVESMHEVNRVFLAPVRKKARGRRPIDGHYTPMNLSAEEKTRIINYARKHYWSDSTVTMGSVVANVIADLYAFRDSDGRPVQDSDGRPLLPPVGSRPSPRQIRYLLGKALSPGKTYAKRHGTAEFLNNKAPTTGTVFDDCIGPGDVYECDDTTLDLHISSESDISIILGKPILHIVVDRYTRLIVGFHISLDASSYEDAKLALLSVCNDWEVLCRQHDVPYRQENFPAQGVICNRYFTDRGPHITFASDELTNAGNDVTTAPALFSRTKAIVESTFRRINGYVKELPGYEPQWNVQKRRRKPYEAQACLTLSEVKGLVLRAMVSLNLEVLKDYPQSAADTEAGLLPIPSELWSREVERLNTLPRRVSRAWLRNKLLSKDEATVTQDGIYFMGNYYTSKEAFEKDWFALAAIRQEFKVTVMFTPKNLDQIQVQDPNRKELQYLASLTSKSVRVTGSSQGLTQERVEEIAAKNRAIRREAEQANPVLKAGFIQDGKRVSSVAEAKLRAATKGKSLASRKSAGQEMREIEAGQARKEDHVVADIEFHDRVSELLLEVEQAGVDSNDTHASPGNEDGGSLSNPNLINDFLDSLEK